MQLYSFILINIHTIYLFTFNYSFISAVHIDEDEISFFHVFYIFLFSYEVLTNSVKLSCLITFKNEF